VLSKDQAAAIARQACESRGLEFREPVQVTRGPFHVTVWTNARYIGGNVVIVLRSRTGRVVKVTRSGPEH
jgi:hypothetical protein